MLLFGVNHDALIQRLTRDDRLGRVGAAVRVTIGGCGTAGALAGGTAAAVLGVRPLRFAAASATLAAGLWPSRSPVWELDAWTVDAGGSSERFRSRSAQAAPASVRHAQTSHACRFSSTISPARGLGGATRG